MAERRRRSSLKPKRSSQGFSLILGFVILGIVAILVGYAFGTFLIGSLADGNKQAPVIEDVEKESFLSKIFSIFERTDDVVTELPKDIEEPLKPVVADPEYQSYQVPSSSFYWVQVGAFAERQRAMILVESLWADGYPAFIIEEEREPKYKVITGLFTIREAADVYAKQLETDGHAVYVASKQAGGVEVQIPIFEEWGQEKVGKLLDNQRLYLVAVAAFWDSFLLTDLEGMDESASLLVAIVEESILLLAEMADSNVSLMEDVTDWYQEAILVSESVLAIAEGESKSAVLRKGMEGTLLLYDNYQEILERHTK